MSNLPPNCKLVVFDLDGTLIDSRKDLVVSVNATRRHYGMGDLDDRSVESFTGSGASVLIERSMGPDFDAGKLDEALHYFIMYYRNHSLDHTVLYPGAREVVQTLAEAGVLQAVLTNKPVRISKDILDGLGLSASFLRIYGGGSFDSKKPDPEGLLRLMEEAGASPSETLMVGDSTVDIQTARNAGCRGCGVTFGFQPETLVDPAPDFLIGHLAELLPIVLDGRSS
ncbi:MAG: HAD-IIIA family hydrolase [Bryobacterales bacterium]|nr:HAD-IIIA family hydrolase [Bryobacterales bacterium]